MRAGREGTGPGEGGEAEKLPREGAGVSVRERPGVRDRPELMPSESKMTHSASVLDCRTPPKKVGDFPYLFGAGPGWAGLVLGNPKEA